MLKRISKKRARKVTGGLAKKPGGQEQAVAEQGVKNAVTPITRP